MPLRMQMQLDVVTAFGKVDNLLANQRRRVVAEPGFTSVSRNFSNARYSSTSKNTVNGAPYFSHKRAMRSVGSVTCCRTSPSPLPKIS